MFPGVWFVRRPPMLEMMVPPVGDQTGLPAPKLPSAEEIQARARWLDSLDPAAKLAMLELPFTELESRVAAWLDSTGAVGDDPGA